ncbi:jg23886, partial [Pararge aegeria aegeria]
ERKEKKTAGKPAGGPVEEKPITKKYGVPIFKKP